MAPGTAGIPRTHSLRVALAEATLAALRFKAAPQPRLTVSRVVQTNACLSAVASSADVARRFPDDSAAEDAWRVQACSSPVLLRNVLAEIRWYDQLGASTMLPASRTLHALPISYACMRGSTDEINGESKRT